MATKLFVGGLAWATTSAQLEEAFAKHGNVVSAQVINDKFSGRSKGFGFVEMDNDEDAQAAIQSMNGADLDGRSIIVNEARPMEARPPRTDGGFGGGNRGGGGGSRGGYSDRGGSRGGGGRY